MGPVTLYISQKQKEGGRTTTLRGVKIALRLWDAFCSLSIPNGRSERSWGWESPQGVRVEGWRHANRQSPGDIWVSVSPIQGTVRPYRWHRNAVSSVSAGVILTARKRVPVSRPDRRRQCVTYVKPHLLYMSNVAPFHLLMDVFIQGNCT